jgi:hypothetical protein
MLCREKTTAQFLRTLLLLIPRDERGLRQMLSQALRDPLKLILGASTEIDFGWMWVAGKMKVIKERCKVCNILFDGLRLRKTCQCMWSWQ